MSKVEWNFTMEPTRRIDRNMAVDCYRRESAARNDRRFDAMIRVIRTIPVDT